MLLDFFAIYDPVWCKLLRNQKGRHSGHCALIEINGGKKGEHHAVQTLSNTLLDGNVVTLIEVREK